MAGIATLQDGVVAVPCTVLTAVVPYGVFSIPADSILLGVTAEIVEVFSPSLVGKIYSTEVDNVIPGIDGSVLGVSRLLANTNPISGIDRPMSFYFLPESVPFTTGLMYVRWQYIELFGR